MVRGVILPMEEYVRLLTSARAWGSVKAKAHEEFSFPEVLAGALRDALADAISKIDLEETYSGHDLAIFLQELSIEIMK